MLPEGIHLSDWHPGASWQSGRGHGWVPWARKPVFRMPQRNAGPRGSFERHPQAALLPSILFGICQPPLFEDRFQMDVGAQGSHYPSHYASDMGSSLRMIPQTHARTISLCSEQEADSGKMCSRVDFLPALSWTRSEMSPLGPTWLTSSTETL